MLAGKKRPLTHIRGDEGIRLLKECLPKEWVVREYTPDYGIDLSVELFDRTDSGFITKGEHVFFQVKCSEILERHTLKLAPRYNVEKEYKQTAGDPVEMDVIKYVLDTDLLATVEAMGSAVPFILTVADAAANDVYFLCLNDYIEKVLVPREPNYTETASKTIYIPIKNKLNSDIGIHAIEWYAKRAKLYALFNKIHYQAKELKYCSQHEFESRIHHFLNILLRFDAWSASDYFGAMFTAKQEIEYYLEHGITKNAEIVINRMVQSGEDVDAEIWETSHFSDPVSFREAERIQGLISLWERLENMGDILEDITKETFLPTYMGASIT